VTAHDWVNGWCRGCGQHDTTMNLTGECSLGLEEARQAALQPNAQSRPPVTPVQPRHPLALLAEQWEERARLLNENARAEQSEQSARYYAARAAEAQDCAAQLREALRAQAEAEAGLREAAEAVLSEFHANRLRPVFVVGEPHRAWKTRVIVDRLAAALAQAGGEG